MSIFLKTQFIQKWPRIALFKIFGLLIVSQNFQAGIGSYFKQNTTTNKNKNFTSRGLVTFDPIMKTSIIRLFLGIREKPFGKILLY